MTIRHHSLAVILCLIPLAVAEAEFIWIEGEDATERQITAHGWYDDVKREVLSGGAWAGHLVDR